MAWTDYSATGSDSWDASIGTAFDSTSTFVNADFFQPICTASTTGSYPHFTMPNTLDTSYNIPGFEDGYQPAGTPDPINGNFSDGGGGGGSTRPTTGMLYPRGQG